MEGLTDDRTRRVLLGVATAAFAVLGAQVGAWAVLIADIAGAVGADTPRLGLALSLMSVLAITGAIVTGRIIDRHGRSVFVVLGSVGTGACLIALSAVGDYASMIAVFVAYGLLSSVYDIVVNALGGDYERAYETSLLPVLHGVFSGAAGVGAIGVGALLAHGVSFRAIYVGTGLLLVLLGIAVASVSRSMPAGRSGATAQPPSDAPGTSQEATASGGVPGKGPGRRLLVLSVPGAGVAAALVALAFFNEGAIEGYSSVYLRDTVGSGVFAGAVGIGIFHFANMAGRFSGNRFIKAFGEATVVAGGGIVAAIGYALALSADATGLVLVGMLLAGFGGAPIVPIAYSIAARWSGDRSGRAASVVTMFGYGSFTLAPSVIGVLGAAVGLQRALLCVLVSSVLIAATAWRVRHVVRSHRDAPMVAG